MLRASCGLGTSHGDFGGDRQHAFAADDERQQVEARAVERIATELDRVTLRGKTAHPQYVMQCEAVLEAMHTTRVLGHIAADGAGDLARWIRGVVQIERRRRFADRQIAHAALHDRGPAQRVDLQDAVEPGQRKRHAHEVGHRAARQAGPRTTCHDRNTQAVTGLEYRCDLWFGLRQRDHERPHAVSSQAVAFVWCRVFVAPDQGMGRQVTLQRTDNLLLAFRTLGGVLRSYVGCNGHGRSGSA